MAKWRKRFEAWAAASAPVGVDEVESILNRVFGDRLTEHAGGSHRWTVDVSEIAGLHRDFQFGRIGLPVKGGKQVKAAYLRIAYRAAAALELLENDEEDRNEEDEDQAD